MSRRNLVIAVVLGLFFIIPVAASAATSLFEDVPDDSVYVNDINWLATAEVTKGCNPPANTRFCPGSNVTREQMAAFMHRLAINRVVDAGTVEGLTAAELKGEPGEPGPTGADGATGPQGNPGVKGDDGDPGVMPGFYVVEQTFEAPDTITEPPRPWPTDHTTYYEATVFPVGDPILQCSDGDVAVDSFVMRTTTRRNDDSGYVATFYNGSYYPSGPVPLPGPYPVTGTLPPTGVAQYGYDLTIQHSFQETEGAQETTEELLVRVTCADLTP